MGFARKTLLVSTGGMSRLLGIKANSKKDRAAKASERQAKLQKQMLKEQRDRDKT
jgi:hypothetical protein